MTTMKNEIKNRIIIAVIILAVIGVISSVIFYSAKPGKLDNFAKCLSEKGAKMYGAYWCSHCQNQKELFGASKNLLPYVECSEIGGQSQKKECTDAKIEGYPTWEFGDKSRLSGELSLEVLAEKTGCQLPQ